jgi:hypothetical protein
MPEAGWYDDPQGGGGKRWWDGQRWSEHTTPPPGSMPQPAATPPPPPGAPGYPAAAGSWDQRGAAATGAWDQQDTTVAGGWQPATSRASGTQLAPAKKGGAGKIVALILVLVVVVGIGVVVAMLLSGSDDVDMVAVDVAQADGTIAQVPEGGTWEMEIDLPSGLVVIDVRGLDEFDPVLELYDPSGAQIGRNDDRSFDQMESYGGDFLDSLLEVEVSAGRHRVVVEGFASRGGRASVSFPVTGG